MIGLTVTSQEVVHSSKTREADCDEQSTQNWKARMDIYKNARLNLIRREQLAQSVLVQKMTLQAAATAFNVCARTAAKWIRRYQQQGSAGLYDHSSRPHRSPRRTGEALEQQVEQLRRQRFTGYHIAQIIGLSRATISRILRRLGLNRWRDISNLPRPSSATSTRLPAICCTSTLSSWAASPTSRSALTAVVVVPIAPAGSIFMSPSTITPALPSPRFV
jgi:transposase